MVDIRVADGKLVLHVHGMDQLWALKSTLEIPLSQITGVRADAAIAHGWWHGLRMPGTNIPGVITAGTFYHDGKRVFWDVHDPDKAIVFDLKDDAYQQLIVEVADPKAAVRLVEDALTQRG